MCTSMGKTQLLKKKCHSGKLWKTQKVLTLVVLPTIYVAVGLSKNTNYAEIDYNCSTMLGIKKRRKGILLTLESPP